MRPAALLLFAVTACDGGPQGPAAFGTTPLTTAKGQSLSVSLFTAPQPPERGAVQARLLFSDLNDARVGGVDVAVTPWMPEHGHGSAVAPTIESDGEGAFLISDLYLAMPGTWQLRVEVTGPVTDELVPSFDVP